MIDNQIKESGAISGAVREVETNALAARMVLRPGTPGLPNTCCYKWAGWSYEFSTSISNWASAVANEPWMTAQGNNGATLFGTTGWNGLFGLQWMGPRIMAVRRFGIHLSSTGSGSWLVAAYRAPSFEQQFDTEMGNPQAAPNASYPSNDRYNSAKTAYGNTLGALKSAMPMSAASQKGTTGAPHDANGGSTYSYSVAPGGLIVWPQDYLGAGGFQGAGSFNTNAPGDPANPGPNTRVRLAPGGMATTDPQPFGCYWWNQEISTTVPFRGYTKQTIPVWLYDSAEVGQPLELDNGMGIVLRFHAGQMGGFASLATSILNIGFHLDWDEYVPTATS